MFLRYPSLQTLSIMSLTPPVGAMGGWLGPPKSGWAGPKDGDVARSIRHELQ